MENLQHINTNASLSELEGEFGLLPKGSCILIYGPPGSTKSTFGYYLATHFYNPINGKTPDECIIEKSRIFLFDSNIDIYKDQVEKCIGRKDIADKILRPVLYKEIDKDHIKEWALNHEKIMGKLGESFTVKDGIIVVDSICCLIDALRYEQNRRTVYEWINAWIENKNTVILLAEDVKDTPIGWLLYLVDIVIRLDIVFEEGLDTRFPPIITLQVQKYRGKKLSRKIYRIEYTGNYMSPIIYALGRRDIQQLFEIYLRETYPNGRKWLQETAYEQAFVKKFNKIETGPDKEYIWAFKDPRIFFLEYLENTFPYSVIDDPRGNPQVLEQMDIWFIRQLSQVKRKK